MALDDMDLDTWLKQLALEAQRHPPKTKERQMALTQLLSTLQRSKRLDRPYQGEFQGMYPDIYAEAVQRLFAFVCDRIDAYNPERGEVLQWVNFLLKKRFFIAASHEWLPAAPKGLDIRQCQRLTVDDLDRCNPVEAQPSQTPSTSDELRQCLEEDTDGTFQAAHIRGKPTANFQAIALMRLDGYTWEEISAALGIDVPTLSSFYQRQLKKFAPFIRQYLQQ